jgi:hypothetical protein
LRTQTTGNDAFIGAPAQIDNGDEALYADKSGTYTKGVLQSGIGLVDLAAYQSFKNALSSGAAADFQNIVLGGPRTLNGPQGGLAFYLQCLDGSQFAVPPAPALASEGYATELVELYWASLLRDVAFTTFPANAVAMQAATELSSLPAYAGPRNAANQVTPSLLFGGGFATVLIHNIRANKYSERDLSGYARAILFRPGELCLPYLRTEDQKDDWLGRGSPKAHLPQVQGGNHSSSGRLA